MSSDICPKMERLSKQVVNCQFNAASIMLCGDEGMSLELKYKCCLEMVLNGNSIQSHKSKTCQLNMKRLFLDVQRVKATLQCGQ